MPRIRVLTFGLMTAVLASGYGVMFTVLDDFRDDYGIRAEWLGAIVGVGFFASFVAQIFLAPIADRGHAKSLVIAGLLLNIVGLVGMAIGETVGVLLIARFIMGVGAGGASPAVRRIVINGDPPRLGSNLGLLLSADVTGFAAGPAISALLVPALGIPAPFIAIAILTAFTLPVAVRVHVAEGVVGTGVEPRFAFDLLRSNAMLAGVMLGVAIFLMIGTFDALWAIVLDDLGASDLISNLGITIFALPLVFLGSYGGRLAQRVGPFRLGPIGLLLGAVFMFLYGFMPTGTLMLTVGIVHAVCDGLTVSSNAVAVGMVAPPARQAAAQGMLGAGQTLTGGLTAVIAGLLYGWGGRELAYVACSVVMVALAILAWVLAGPVFRDRRGEMVGSAPEPSPALGHA